MNTKIIIQEDIKKIELTPEGEFDKKSLELFEDYEYAKVKTYREARSGYSVGRPELEAVGITLIKEIDNEQLKCDLFNMMVPEIKQRSVGIEGHGNINFIDINTVEMILSKYLQP